MSLLRRVNAWLFDGDGNKLTSTDNRLNTSINTIGKNEPFVMPFGEFLVGQKNDNVVVQFQYNYFDEQFDVNLPTLIGTATRGITDSVAYVEGNTSGDISIISSIDSVRYVPGHSGFIDFTLACRSTGTGKVWGGGFDTSFQNGFVAEIKSISGVKELNFGFLKNGTEYGSNFTSGFDSVNLGSFQIENISIYRILFGFLGVANPVLCGKINGKWYVLHEVETEGKGLLTHTSTPVFPITVVAFDDAIGYTASWNGGTIGVESSVGKRSFAFPIDILSTTPLQGSMNLSGTATGTLVIFHSKTTFKSKENNIKATLLNYSFTVDTPTTNVIGTVAFQIVAVSTLSGTPTYSDINTNSSVFEYDHVNGSGATVNVSTGIPILTEYVGYAGGNKGASTGSITIDAERLGAVGYKDNTFAIIAKDLGGNNVTVRSGLVWEESF